MTGRWWPRGTGGPGFLLAPWTADAIAGELSGVPMADADLVEGAMKVTVNDEAVEVDEQTTVAGLLERLGFPEKGIAVAVDWAVLPRSQWQTTLSDGARLEVVTAVQGG